MKDLERWEMGNPEDVAIRREAKKKPNPAIKLAMERAKREAEELFKPEKKT